MCFLIGGDCYNGYALIKLDNNSYCKRLISLEYSISLYIAPYRLLISFTNSFDPLVDIILNNPTEIINVSISNL